MVGPIKGKSEEDVLHKSVVAARISEKWRDCRHEETGAVAEWWWPTVYVPSSAEIPRDRQEIVKLTEFISLHRQFSINRAINLALQFELRAPTIFN